MDNTRYTGYVKIRAMKLVPMDRENHRQPQLSGRQTRGTMPERLVMKESHKRGYRYRKDPKIDKIRPDIKLTKYRVAIFIHGCYWHQHDKCKLAYSDRHYSEVWREKFRKNRERDTYVESILVGRGWRIAVIWECVTRNSVELSNMLDLLVPWIRESDDEYFESAYHEKS